MEKLYELIDAHDVISFDIYDTLIFRYINKREDVFALAAYKNNIDNVRSFIKQRTDAELYAHKKYKTEEITLDMIYEPIYANYGSRLGESLKRDEEKLEIGLSTKNNEVFQAFQYAIEHNKIVYIISDMYLTKATIEAVLDKNNIKGYKKLFVSSEIGLTKATGNLFSYVIKQESLEASRVLHIGDNINNDVKQARKKAINAFHYISNIKIKPTLSMEHLTESDELLFKCNNIFIERNLDVDRSRIYQVGYKFFGPFLYGYCQWILSLKKQLELKKIFCLSRDGYVISKALQALTLDNESYEYFYTSRTATVIPTLISVQSISEIIDSYKSWPEEFDVHHFLYKVGLSRYDISTILEEFKSILGKMYTRESVLVDSDFIAFFEKIIPHIREVAKEQNSLLKEYFEKHGFNDRIGIADIGGSGTIENALNNLKEQNLYSGELYPLYILSNLESTTFRRAYLFDANKNKIIRENLRFFYMLLEILVTAPHESVWKYCLKDSQIVPKFGIIGNTLDDNLKYSEYFIEELQEGVLQYIKDIKDTSFNDFVFSPNLAIQNLMEFGIDPKIKYLSEWDKFSFDCDGMKYVFSKANSDLNSIKIGFEESLWPLGYLKFRFNNSLLNRTIWRLYKFYKKIKS